MVRSYTATVQLSKPGDGTSLEAQWLRIWVSTAAGEGFNPQLLSTARKKTTNPQTQEINSSKYYEWS